MRNLIIHGYFGIDEDEVWSVVTDKLTPFCEELKSIINEKNILIKEAINYAKEENIPILMEIPFNRKIAEAYSKGVSIIEMMPEWKKKFLGLYGRIEGLVNERACSD